MTHIPSPRIEDRLSAEERRAVEALDTAAMVAAIQDLVRIESWGGREGAAQKRVGSLMHESGLEVDAWEIDLDEVQEHPDCSWEIERDHALGVVGSLQGGESGRTLLLNGHVDVVPPGDESLWNHPPFAGVVEHGRIYGRGALDMKGPLLAGLFAMKALTETRTPLAGTVRLMSVIGEEDGGIGTLASILRGYRGDGAIVMEPTELAVVPTQAGCVNFRIRVPGRAAHGAIREEGVSAFEKLFVVYEAVQRLENERNEGFAHDPLYARYPRPFPISIGTMGGGDWASSVPDHATMEGRLGVRPDEEIAQARAALEAAVADAAAHDAFLRDHPPTVEWWGGRFLPAAIPRDHPLVLELTRAVADLDGGPPPLEAVPFGTDAGLLHHVGSTPTVLFGAGDISRAHRVDEYVEIDELTRMARAIVVTAMRFCGVASRSLEPPHRARRASR